MLKNLLGLIAMVGLVSLAGCSKKDDKKDGAKGGKAGFDCKAACEKNKKCVDSFVKVALAKVPEKFRDRAKAGVERGVKRGLAGEKCVERCERQMGKDDRGQKASAECMKKSDCDAYAKCIFEVVMKGRKGRRRMRRRGMMKPE